MRVPNADFFLLDVLAQDAVAEGIAVAMGVPPSYAEIAVSKLRRLATARAGGRRLVEMVKIVYTVTIPSTAGVSKAKEIVQRAFDVTVADLSRLILRAVAAAKGSTFVIMVTSKSTPVIDYVAESAAGNVNRNKVKPRSGSRRTTHSGVASALALLFATYN